MSDQNETPFEFSRPVVVIPGAFTIPDLALMAEINMAVSAGDQSALFNLTPKIVELMDRIVEGGTAGRPATEFQQLWIEVQTQIAASRKN